MKDFKPFDPLHPFQFNESLQVKNRKIHLSYIPLVDSVSIKGFLQAKTPSDVVANSFWVDYRFEDGYRSSNAEIIFDSSANDQFIDVSYLGIGTILRAEDMNEAAESLNSLDKSRNEADRNIHDLSIRAGIIESNAQDSLQFHNQNSISHKDIRDSIQASKDEFEYRLGVFDTRILGIQSRIDATDDSIESQMVDLNHFFRESLESSITQLRSEFAESINSIDDYRDEFTGIYNSIARLGSEFQSDREATVNQVESLLAVERKSFSTTVNNAKSEAISRSVAEAQKFDDSLKMDFETSLRSESNARYNLGSEIQFAHRRIDNIEVSNLSLDSRLNSEMYARIESNNELQGLIATYRDDSDAQIESITSNVANLADTLYQARQATNRQIESLRANVAIAEDRMLNTAERLDSLTSKNQTLTESLNAGLEDIDSLKNSMEEYVESRFEPVRTEFATSLANFDSVISDSIQTLDRDLFELDDHIGNREFYVDEYFTQIESSVAAVWDEIDDVEDSISALNLYDSSLQNSIGTANSNIGTLNSTVSTAYSRLGTLNTSLATNYTSLKSANTNISNLTSSLNALTTRVTNLENKTLTIPTTPSTVVGAIWYT